MKPVSKKARSRKKPLQEEPQEEEENDVFVPSQFTLDQMEAEDDSLSAQVQRLVAIVKQKRQVLNSLKSEADMLDSASRGFHFQIERYYAQRQPVWWWVLMIASFLCALGMYDKSRYVFAALALVAHKFLWRSFYLERNAGMQLFAVVVVALCVIF